jgi:hypothetical protein
MRNLMPKFSLCRDYCDRTECLNFNQFLLVVSLSGRVLSGISPAPLMHLLSYQKKKRKFHHRCL